MSFGLKNVGATYMRAMTTMFHDMIHKEIEVYVDDVIIKSKKAADHMEDLRKFFNRLRRYNLKLNPAKYAFGVPTEKLLGFIKLRHYFCAYTTYLISRMNPSKYIFQKPMPTGKLAKWKILLSEFDIVYITQKEVKGQALADHLTENTVGEECEPLKTYFPDEEELRKRFTKTEFKHVPRIQNEFADALSTLSSMIQHPDTNFIDPIQVKIYDRPAYCAHVEEEADGKLWFHDIKEYLTIGEYPELANATQKRTFQRLSKNLFHSGGTLYRRTPDLGLLRCVEAR
ncbi:uncharacterized protein [Nicotiana sylvestris]|uniref:uncharacterized protein n=1 Tax=Nicotiana sylvestris TaxID=4096 RepID=UPI00388C5224